MVTREQIETSWLSENRTNRGTPLCRFTSDINLCLGYKWHEIWHTDDNPHLMVSGLYYKPIHTDYIDELTYLTRALSLNMLLDDNNVK